MSKTKKIDTSKYAHICIALTHNHKCIYTQHFESSRMKDVPPKPYPCVNPKF